MVAQAGAIGVTGAIGLGMGAYGYFATGLFGLQSNGSLATGGQQLYRSSANGLNTIIF